MSHNIMPSSVIHKGYSANTTSLPPSAPLIHRTETDISSLSPLKRKQITDDIGTIHGQLTVLSYAYCKNGQIWYNCRCSCGNEKPIRRDYLLNGHTSSCGCLVKETDISGQQFGLWTVLQRDTTKQGPPAYICRCACGTERSVDKRALKAGRTLSCGCRRSTIESCRRRDKQGKKTADCADCNDNQLLSGVSDLTNQRFGRLLVLEPIETGRYKNDKPIIKWRCKCDCGNETLVLAQPLKKGITISCGCYQVQSRKESLKIAQAGNGVIDDTNVHLVKSVLSGKLPKNNTSGVRGVTFTNGRYIATITFRKQHYYLGRYERIEEAALARKKAEEALYGEWLEHYEKDLKAERKAEYEVRKKAIYEVLKRMREYRGNDGEASEVTRLSGASVVIEETKE